MSIKIVNGKRGYHLKVNGMFISQGFTNDIKAIKNSIGIPYGATEWVYINAVRQFWNQYRPIIVHSTTKPYESVWGQLVPLNK